MLDASQPAAVVDVRWGVLGILEAIEAVADRELVVLRRFEDGEVHWYAWPAERLRGQLAGAPEDGDVTRILDLHESGSAPFHDLDSGPPADDFYGVAARSDGTVRVIEPPARGGGDDVARGSHALGASKPAARRLFPLIEGPHQVDVDETFLLEVGLAQKQAAGVAGGPVFVLGDAVVEAHVSAPDFELRAGEGWRHELTVAAGAPLPTFVLHLTPKAEGQFPVQVSYSVAGEVLGYGVRFVRVGTAPVVAVPPAGGAGFSTATSAAPPDLTVTAVVREKRGYWTFQSPHAGIALPDRALDKGLGDDPKQFARNLLINVPAEDATSDAYDYLLGAGDAVSSVLPSRFWHILAQVAQAVGPRPPRLLLLTNDPYVPWELAKMDQPIDAAAPPLLGAQVDLGRWVLDPDEPDSKPLPPEELAFGDLRVFWGNYDEVKGWKSLAEAEEETAELERRFGIQRREASFDELMGTLDELRQDDRPHGLHFAGHGVFGDGGPRDGLVLGKGKMLKPFHVRGKRLLAGSPFVFLNACEVGAAHSTVGGYGGMTGAFLRAGAGGMLAPLWKVDDEVARDFALEFYRQAAAPRDAVPAAAVLRSLRARFTRGGPSTWVAYQYYGHPALTLKR